jgi:hypothetical protein
VRALFSRRTSWGDSVGRCVPVTRNIRAAGLGATREPIAVSEVVDAKKPPILRAYVRRWWFEVARFFEGVTRDASLDELQRIAPGFPVFRIEPLPMAR